MAGVGDKSLSQFYGDLFQIDNSNSGVDGSVRQVKDGTGDTFSIYCSNDKFKVQPSADSTTNTVIYDKDGNALVTIDSTNDLVKAGIGQHIINTQFKEFGVFDFSPIAGTHHPLVVNGGLSEGTAYTGDVNAGNWGGTGTNPATSLTVSSVAEQLVPSLWLLQQNITIDQIQYVMSADGSTTVNLHVMSYDVATGTGSTAGDLSNGAVIGDSSALTVGDDRVSNGTIAVQTADNNSGKAIVVFAENIGGTDDISVQVNLKYHLR